MRLSKRIYLTLLFVCSLAPSFAYADRILDKVEVIQAQTETEIHIEFLTQVRYVRHSPTNKQTSRVQIFLDFPQLSKNALPTQREFRNSLGNNLVPSFTVNYPEQQPGSFGVRFKKPINFTITPDNSGRGIVIRIPLDKSRAPTVASSVQAEASTQPLVDHGPQGEVPAKPANMSDDDYAKNLLIQSKNVRGNGDHAKAVQLLNVILNLPANNSSQEAQELIGSSRERLGEKDKAIAEYETYLKLYPKGEGADRVRQRLASLSTKSKVAGAEPVKAKKTFSEIHENTVSGSLNQYYYSGHTHNYNSDPDPSRNRTTHDQSQLISSLDLTARFRQNQWDNKIVFRDTQTMNFLSEGEDRNRLQAAYVEINNKEADYLARIGRQNGNSGGVLGRFDGALFRYGLTPKYKLNFVLGALDEYRVDYRRHFYGVNLDIGPVFDKWSGNAYYVNQRVGDIKDREAIGAEVRYFDNNRSVYTILDYDTMFQKVNIAMVQGNLQTESGANYNILLDHRKSPLLTMINSLTDPAFQNQAVYPTTPTNLRKALLMGQSANLTESQLRQYAFNQALDTDLILFGVTKQFTPRWQLGGDVQVSRVSGQPGASDGAIALAEKVARDNGTFLSDLERQNLRISFASGNTYTYHGQAVGIDTIFKNDTSVISLSYIDAPTSQIQSLVLTNVMVPREKWRLDSSIKLMRLDIDPSTLQYVVAPSVRASYQLREKASLEAEIGLEMTNIHDQVEGHSRTFRDFSFIGYRLDI